MTERLSLSVIIPAYKRGESLARCLKALENQVRLPDEVLVVKRDGDTEVENALTQFASSKLLIRTVYVFEPGQVQALNAGLAAISSNSQVVCMTDDDTAPHTDWIEKIERHFLEDAELGGVGGRDEQVNRKSVEPQLASGVGVITWYGKIMGGHHQGVGEKRFVDHLRGANMSYRKEAISGLFFDTSLRGRGAQVYNDLAFSFAVRNAGWKLLYDPELKVDHFQEERFEKDMRGNFNYEAVVDGSFNRKKAVFKNLSFERKLSYLLYSLLIGDKFTPGLVQTLRLLPLEGLNGLKRFFATLQGLMLFSRS